MIVNLKAILLDYHPALCSNPSHCCDLRSQDPDFNHGHGDQFYNAVNRAIQRGDFK